MEQLFFSNKLDHPELTRIIQSNHRIRKTVQSQVNKFLILQENVFAYLHDQLPPVSILNQTNASFININGIQSLNNQVRSPNIELALVGANSCGKTSFLHFLLSSGNFLPTDVGPISARTIRLTYADAQNAELLVYQSLDNKQIHEQVSLNQFFVNTQEPDWNGIKTAIKDHVTRPNSEIIKKCSAEFEQWAKCFVEIRIPSPFLKLGFNIYDTPGLLYSDPFVLKENLCQLVKLYQPTLVFMYDNPSISSDTQNCFLALKDTLSQLTDTSMFFLNTKADIDHILADANPDDEYLSDEDIFKILSEEHQKRYQFLLNVPSMTTEFPGGLPKSLKDCPCFDMISVNSDTDPVASQLNRTTINRLIQFAASSDLKLIAKMSSLVLPIINAFFDFALITNHRTIEQFDLLRHEAREWIEQYFVLYRNHLDILSIELYRNILKQLNDEIPHIAQRASQFQTTVLIENYIKTVVQEEIIKVAIEKIKAKYLAYPLFDIENDINLINIAQKNDFLMNIHHSSIWCVHPETNSFKNKELSQVFSIVYRIFIDTDLVIDTVMESDDEEEEENDLKSVPQYKRLIKQGTLKKQSLKKNLTPLDTARQRLSEISSVLTNQKKYISKLIDQWNDTEKAKLLNHIEQCYELALEFLSHRKTIHEVVHKYADIFANIECKLVAAMDLATFNGKVPRLSHPFPLDNRVYSAEWKNKKNLIVKTTSEYLEVHYYRKITQLQISHIIPLVYLYENEETGEFWMFFPTYTQRLDDNSRTIDQILEIAINIAHALAQLHQNEIVHRNIKYENIVLDEKGQCYLTNFDPIEFNTESEIESISDKIADDICQFGQLEIFLCERVLIKNMNISHEDKKKLTEFRNLLSQCTDKNKKVRPKAVTIVEKLREIQSIFTPIF